MPKISATNSKGLFITYFIKIALSTVLSIAVINSAASLIFLKMDIDLSAGKYVGIAAAVITSVIVSLISTTGFKNNFLLLSAISVIPLALFIFVNMLINHTDSTICIIKLVCVFASAIIVSFIKSAKKRWKYEGKGR